MSIRHPLFVPSPSIPPPSVPPSSLPPSIPSSRPPSVSSLSPFLTPPPSSVTGSSGPAHTSFSRTSSFSIASITSSHLPNNPNYPPPATPSNIPHTLAQPVPSSSGPSTSLHTLPSNPPLHPLNYPLTTGDLSFPLSEHYPLPHTARSDYPPVTPASSAHDPVRSLPVTSNYTPVSSYANPVASSSHIIRTSFPSSSLPPRIPCAKGAILSEYNAGVLGLSVPYKKLAMRHFENYLRLEKEFVIINYPELTSDYDKDHQGGNSVYMGSLEVGLGSSSSIPPFSTAPPPITNEYAHNPVSCTPSVPFSVPSQRVPIQVFRRDIPVEPHTVHSSSRDSIPRISTNYQTSDTFPIFDISNPIMTSLRNPVNPVTQDFSQMRQPKYPTSSMASTQYPDYPARSSHSRYPEQAVSQSPSFVPDRGFNPVQVPDPTPDRVPYVPTSI